MSSPVIEVVGLHKSFGRSDQQEVITSLDLTVRPGEFVTVVGASGCGKSTLLNILAGLDQPTQGNVLVRGKVALMFQDATLLPWLTAIQNIKLALQLQGLREPARTARAAELLELVRLGEAMHKRPHELSGGMKQRVALARCLAQDASIVLMDEPLGALDAMTRDHLHDEIESLTADHGLTVVFVTHNMREAVRLGDRVVLMGSNPGRIIHEEVVGLPRPRVIDSSEIATRAARLTMQLKGHAVS
ncbi:MAG: ABC transporter ATP-binding protein [Candidatus Limnocylindrus sp.]